MFDSMRACYRHLVAARRGVAALEYAIIAGVLVAAVGAAITPLFNLLNTFFAGFTYTP